MAKVYVHTVVLILTVDTFWNGWCILLLWTRVHFKDLNHLLAYPQRKGKTLYY